MSTKTEEKDKKKEGPNVDELILKNLVEISGKLGDLLVAANGAGIIQKILGRGLSDGTLGLGGFWSSLVALWGHYKK